MTIAGDYGFRAPSLRTKSAIADLGTMKANLG
jgi:hypothetical protein